MSEERRSQTRRPDDWLFEKLNDMSDTEGRHHHELRSRIDQVIARQDERHEDHSARILTIEIQRASEKANANAILDAATEKARKTAALQSLGIAALLTSGWEIFKREMLGWK